jgi:hypothetical protein
MNGDHVHIWKEALVIYLKAIKRLGEKIEDEISDKLLD